MVSKFQYTAFGSASSTSLKFKSDIEVTIRLCISAEVESNLDIACPAFVQRTEDCPKVGELGYTWKGIE